MFIWFILCLCVGVVFDREGERAEKGESVCLKVKKKIGSIGGRLKEML